MAESLRDLRVLVLDCQAGGATPAHGDLLELGWALLDPRAPESEAHSYWLRRRTGRPVSRAVRELTGWSESCLEQAISEEDAWAALGRSLASLRGAHTDAPVPTVIHFARFELPFLRDLHERLGPLGPFPLDAVCLHAMATRLFPQLPRRNLRALSGYLGFSPELVRRAAGHVAASAFIWRELLPRLEQQGVTDFSELKLWLAAPSSAASSGRARAVFPLPPERRLRLPDRPGVYRFVRKSGDVLYVGKATSLKKRVASHFSSKARAGERALEMLTQVHDIHESECASVLEAALLESDEIKRLDPPYNVQLRTGERAAWFASRDLHALASAPDASHTLGPLPSRGSLVALWALLALSEGAEPTPRLRAAALAVPHAFGPDESLFREGFTRFAEEHLARPEASARARVLAAARSLWLARGRREPEVSDEAAPDLWDLARVRRRLERHLIHAGLLLRRARFLRLLVHADVAYRESGMAEARLLWVTRGSLSAGQSIAGVWSLAEFAPRELPSLAERKACYDASVYDRMRVLATELRRVVDEGGEVALRVGRHLYAAERFVALTRTV